MKICLRLLMKYEKTKYLELFKREEILKEKTLIQIKSFLELIICSNPNRFFNNFRIYNIQI